MANCHIHETPDLNPLPAAEQAVLLKALAKNPEDRFPSCLAFAKALREAVFPPPEPPAPAAGERRSGRDPTTIAVATLSRSRSRWDLFYFLRNRRNGTTEQPQRPSRA